MSPDPPLWQALDVPATQPGEALLGRLERDPRTGRYVLTLADADDLELTFTLDRDGARALALALLDGQPA